ncbi:MAG: hypothetical protein RL169_1386 [Armatimonadota bacterium]|jgi:hypothetical protein
MIILPIPLVVVASILQGTPSAKQVSVANPLPVKAVTVFTSGVSFTLREGMVDGDASIPLSFRTTQINDILKSMVLLDTNGTVQPATLATKDPVGRTLQSFAVDVTQPMGRVELLNRLRGTRVKVGYTPPKGENRISEGQIVSVEAKATPGSGNTPGEITETLLLLGDAGLISINLQYLDTLSFTDERIQKEFQQALGLLAGSADDRKRQIMLRFDGKSKRTVRVGYVTESPVWKVSYRVLLGDADLGGKADADPFLQGWALVENTTDEDWTNVKLSLVSGRPVSFIQDLYQPLYVPRPTVAPDFIGSPMPQFSEVAVDRLSESLSLNRPASPNGRSAGRGGTFGGGSGGMGGGGFGGMSGVEAKMDAAAPATLNFAEMRDSVAAQATGDAAGELFRYDIAALVNLPRQQAAMIPIVTEPIKAKKISIYNANTNAIYPMNGVSLTNSTSLFLKAGPATIFDSGTYAGDGRIPDMPAKSNRVITYAIDQAIRVDRGNAQGSSSEVDVNVARGVMIIQRRELLEQPYSIKNEGSSAKTVWVEHPRDDNYTLVAPKDPQEKTPGFLRFEVDAPAGKTTALTVKTQRLVSEEVGLLDGGLDRLSTYSNKATGVSPAVKAILAKVLLLRQQVQVLQSQLVERQAEVDAVGVDQDRIRKNMAALDKSDSLYKRYVNELEMQENTLVSLRKAMTELRAKVGTAERDLRAYVSDQSTIAK